MSFITILLRALPLLIRRSALKTPWMAKLNQELPLCVMVVLVVHSLGGGALSATTLWPQIVALVAVALTYLRWRNSLLSVVIGIGVLATLSVPA